MGGKQIEVRCKKSPYTNIQNSLIWDERLRPQTKWVLIAMLSLPDDWDYSIRGLAKKTGLSKETISKMLVELEQAGYLYRKPQSHGEGGRFAGTEYILTDDPSCIEDIAEEEATPEVSAPCPNLLDTDAPCPNLPCTVNSPQQNNIITNIPPIVPHKGDVAPDLFERFWKAYPIKKAKERARRAWRKIHPDIELCRKMAAALELDKQSDEWKRDGGRYIPHPATWLNGKRWEDEHLAVDLPPAIDAPLRGEGVVYI